MKPKPYSIERRFQLMQAGVVGLAVVMIMSVLYWHVSFQNRLTASVHRLHSTIALETEIHTIHELTAAAFWESYYSERPNPEPEYEAHARRFTAVLQRYSTGPLPDGDQAEVDALRRLEEQFLSQSASLLEGDRNPGKDASKIGVIDALCDQIESNLGMLEELQIKRLEMLDRQIETFSRWMMFVLLSLAAFAILAIASFRYVHRHSLWEPLDELRQMVAEVRRGNLNVTGEIPQSVELGSLVSAFLAMASELQEMRISLEKKVVERTSELAESQKELFQSAKLASLGHLVAGVAHEINNPLTSILGFSEVLLGRPGTDPATLVPLRTIRGEAVRLRNLVANLSSFARRAPHRTRSLDLRSILTRLADLRDYQLGANNVTLHLDSPAAPVWIDGDPDQLLQVFLNMVLNSEQAIKASRERGDIWLACGIKAGAAWFTVKDNGAGMTPDAREHMFDPFFTTKPPGEGTGLGLSISHGVIQQHRGLIEVESNVGEGTSLRVTLPLLCEDPSPRPEKASPRQVEHSGASKAHGILVIDDENGILEMVESALMPMNCRVRLLHGAAEAESTLSREKFDLVLCDLKMPGLTGFEIFQMIREKHPGLVGRFLLMTGNLADADKHAAELAAVPILAKPFTIAQLREAVSQLLSKGPSRNEVDEVPEILGE